jgi:hypothetical protein
VAKAILTEVPVKRKNRLKSLDLDQGKGCAVGEAEVFIRMAKENALRLGLDRWGDAKDDNSRGSSGPKELRGKAVARTGPDERARFIHDVVRGVKLGSDGYEAGADFSGGGVERIVAIHDSEEAPAVNEPPHEVGFFHV